MGDGGFLGFISRHRATFSLGFVALMISSLGDLVAGATLGYMTDTLALLPGLMVLIPPAIGMRGNIFGALGSRLGTSMHVGTFELSLRKGGILRNNMEASLVLTLIISLLMGILAKIICEAFGVSSIPVEQFIFISVFGGVLAGLALLVINIVVADIGFRRQWDIDNISAPIITAAGDIITLPMLFLAAIIVMDGGKVAEWAVEGVAIVSIILSVALAYRSYRMEKSETRRIIMHSLPVLAICIVLDVFAGLTIEQQLGALVTLPVILVMIPPFLEDANALGGILTSRLSSMLHMGTLEPDRLPRRMALENFAIIYIFSIYVFTLVGLSAYLVGTLLGLASPPLFDLLALSLFSGLITVTVLNIISYYVAVTSFRFRLDPDDHSIPFTSSAIDFVGAGALMLGLVLLGLA
ncbi:MAG: Divalent cation transporter [Methanomassiliicoccales archaeon PtaU1.Bin124]|nr:MAG: Divalent cation transporter [Methanomassiliicoccales archaeon PtaU1.Bin124]